MRRWWVVAALVLLALPTASSDVPIPWNGDPGTAGQCLIAGGAGANPTWGTCGAGSGAPTDATYLTQTANATLTAEQAMGVLGTGITINTTTTGVQSIYAGASCTNQFPRSLDASGAATCASVQDADAVAAFSRDSEAPAAGDITGSLSAGYQIGSGVVGTAEVATALKTEQIAYTFFDTATDLPNTLDIPSIYPNRARAITLTEVYCEIDAGSASINLQRDDGTPANILASDLACSTAGATAAPAAAEDNVAVGNKIDHVTVSVGAGLRRLNVAVTYTVD